VLLPLGHTRGANPNPNSNPNPNPNPSPNPSPNPNPNPNPNPTQVIPEEVDGRIQYQASSPDEGALVEAARRVGWEFVKRTSTSLHYMLHGEEHVSNPNPNPHPHPNPNPDPDPNPTSKLNPNLT